MTSVDPVACQEPFEVEEGQRCMFLLVGGNAFVEAFESSVNSALGLLECEAEEELEASQ